MRGSQVAQEINFLHVSILTNNTDPKPDEIVKPWFGLYQN